MGLYQGFIDPRNLIDLADITVAMNEATLNGWKPIEPEAQVVLVPVTTETPKSWADLIAEKIS